MLKGISNLISPTLLKVLDEMGHGDEIVLGDSNFPGHSVNDNCIRLDGVKMPELLKGILKLIPLDTYSDSNFILMDVVNNDSTPSIWEKYERISEVDKATKIEKISRYDFYERSKKAYCVVITGETSVYANIILKKGVIK